MGFSPRLLGSFSWGPLLADWEIESYLLGYKTTLRLPVPILAQRLPIFQIETSEGIVNGYAQGEPCKQRLQEVREIAAKEEGIYCKNFGEHCMSMSCLVQVPPTGFQHRWNEKWRATPQYAWKENPEVWVYRLSRTPPV